MHLNTVSTYGRKSRLNSAGVTSSRATKLLSHPLLPRRFPRSLKKRQQRSWSSILNAHFGKNSPSYMPNHRPDPSKLKPRMARHWSDVAVMSTVERFADEKLFLDL